jgi:hypothetical protein
LDIKDSLPSIEAFYNERVKILFKTKTSKDGSDFCHSSAVTWRTEDSRTGVQLCDRGRGTQILDLVIEVV